MKRIFQKKRFKILIFSSISFFLFFVLFTLYRDKCYYEVLSVQLGDCNIPYVNVTIEGSCIPLEVDLGSRLEMDIHSDILEKFQKSAHGVEKWKNFRGTEFEYPTYILPKIALGSLTFNDPIVVEFSPKRKGESVIWKGTEHEHSPTETVGHLGRGLLKQVNFLIDIESSKMIITNSSRKLKSNGYHLATFDKIPFKLGPKGIIIEVDTDLGRMSFLLDTGCTWTMVHEFLYPKNLKKKIYRYGFPVISSNHFIMNGVNFGSQDFYFINMTEELKDVDGFLGMDFIKKHIIYIDFSKKLLYMSSPKSF